MGSLEKNATLNRYSIWSINVFCHLVIIPAIIYGEWWMLLYSFIWWQFVHITAGTSGYHRYWTHNSFKIGKWYEIYSQIIGLFGNPGPALVWIGVHRDHHKYVDTEKDPHSPKHKGFWWVYTSGWFQAGFRYIPTEREDLKDWLSLSKNSSLKWFYDNYLKLHALIILIFFLIDPLLLVFGYCLPIVFANHGYGLINAYCHRHGEPSNNLLIALITGGEGWHLNHHNDQNKYRFGEIDPGARFIKWLQVQ